MAMAVVVATAERALAEAAVKGEVRAARVAARAAAAARAATLVREGSAVTAASAAEVKESGARAQCTATMGRAASGRVEMGDLSSPQL